MSITVVHCIQCGNSDLHGISICLDLKKFKWCEACHRSEQITEHAMFCSPKCFEAFMADSQNPSLTNPFIKLCDNLEKKAQQ